VKRLVQSHRDRAVIKDNPEEPDVLRVRRDPYGRANRGASVVKDLQVLERDAADVMVWVACVVGDREEIAEITR
jgi:hypothetical protein